MNPQDGPAAAESVSPEEPLVNLDEQLAFLNLTDEDARRLRELHPKFQQSADKFVESFYQHLFSFEVTARLLKDRDRFEQLKGLQREYFDSLLGAQWDDDYVARRQAIGHTHAEVGLDAQWFLGAYNQYVQSCFRHLAADYGPDAEECAEHMLSLMKVIFLDIGLTLNAYFFQATEKLRQALDMYWKANHDLRQFAQLTSHDLKTPIATIANLCDEALDEFGEQMPPEARRLIVAARERTFQTSTMIDELLTSTLSFDPAQSPDEVSSEVILREALDRLQPALDEKQIEVQLPDTYPYVWGNRVRLREAFFNLLANAVKFMDKRPGSIEIDVSVEDARCVFTITDNGPGIPTEELVTIFAPFRRLKAHRDHPGSGLGLYFTKHLVEQEGGRVWAESQVDAGSKFHVMLNRGPRAPEQ